MIERKCLECQTWNKDEDYCNSCKAPLSPKALDLVRTEKLAIEEANRPRTLLEKLKSKADNSKYFIVKFTFYVFYGFMLFLWAIGAFFAWMTALANG